MARFRNALLATLCACAVTGARAGEALCHTTLAKVQQGEFFQFFGLVKLSEEPTDRPEETARVYTNGGSLKGKVMLAVKTGNALGEVHSAAAMLVRSFIDTGATGAFARDYAKSFLAAAVAPESEAEAKALVEEIWHSVPPGAQAYARSGEGYAAVPAGPGPRPAGSKAFQVFLGLEQDATVLFRRDSVRFQNVTFKDGTKVLFITVEPR